MRFVAEKLARVVFEVDTLTQPTLAPNVAMYQRDDDDGAGSHTAPIFLPPNHEDRKYQFYAKHATSDGVRAVFGTVRVTKSLDVKADGALGFRASDDTLWLDRCQLSRLRLSAGKGSGWAMGGEQEGRRRSCRPTSGTCPARVPCCREPDHASASGQS